MGWKDKNQQAQTNSEMPELEIGDVDSYQSDKFQVFNHQALVMNILNKCIEAGTHEMRQGWYNEKTDQRGNVTRTYIEDTRLKFVSCVKTAMAVMSCDYDEQAEETIDEYLDELEVEKKKLLKQQSDWWNSLPMKPKGTVVSMYGEIQNNFFNESLGWWQIYVELERECYNAIFQELGKLSKRLDFYQATDFEN